MKTIIKAIHSQTGHPQYQEDTWQSDMEIEDEMELFSFMKEMHKASARGFSSYPFVHLFSPYLQYQKCNEIEVNGEIFRTPFIDCNAPEYAEKAVKKYNEWYAFIKNRLPLLQDAYKKRVEKEREIATLNALKEKYSN